MQSKEIKMQPSDIERILGTKKYAEAVEKGEYRLINWSLVVPNAAKLVQAQW